MTDETCSDGQYREVLPNPNAPGIPSVYQAIDASVSPSAEEMANFLLELFDKGYPYASYILRSAPDFQGERCPVKWVDVGGVGSKLGVANLVVHECGHFLDRGEYHIAENYRLRQPSRDYFHRVEISKDQYHQAIPGAFANDTYFDPGAETSAQGIQTMYDEWAQYIHSTAVDYLIFEKKPYIYNIEAMLNFAWAAQRYLLLAKQKHPDDFNHMMNDADVRESTLVLWGQTWHYYDAFANNTKWTPSNEQTRYIDQIRTPELLDIMNELRKAHGCQGTL